MATFRQHDSRYLGTALLASVSRSFYLSIKVLPPKVRGPLGLAYLLARTADTIADTTEVPAELRTRHLRAFEGMIRNGVDLEKLLLLQHEIVPPIESERALLKKMEPCLDWLGAQPETDRAAIVNVLEKIISGQLLDIERFSDAGHPQALQNAGELDEYTYLVAGCVGEFWTRICCRNLRNFAGMGEEQLCAIGVNFGKGLQLVNILRDMPADLRAGRCYLPAGELKAAGVDPVAVMQSPELARPVFDRWLAKAGGQIDAGFQYVEALSNWRVRLACILPWAIGVRTLDLMSKDFPLTAAGRVKVSRSEVRRIFFHALCAASSNGMLRAMRDESRKSLAAARDQAPVFARK